MPQTVEIRAPESQDEGTESVLSAWLKQPGEAVRQYEPIAELATDKVNIEVASPADGVLSEILKQADEPVEPGELLGRIAVDSTSRDVRPAPDDAQRGSAAERTAAGGGGERLSPAVRRLVQKHNLNVDLLHGSGRGGRLTLEDVERHLQAASEPRTAPAPPQPSQVPKESKPGQSSRVPHSPMRKRIAQHMVQSLLHTAPHVTAVFEADLSAVIADRRKRQAEAEKRGIRLTFTAYFVAAAVQALQAVPEVNGRWHDDYLELFQDCNIGVAAAVQGGLIVPVVRRAQTLDLAAIAASLQDLTERARQGKLERQELEGGTLTITNHGVSGSLIATPIINQPQSAILGIGKMQKRVVVEEVRGVDSIQIRPLVYVTLTIDHRALDGFQANAFLSKFVEVLESWD